MVRDLSHIPIPKGLALVSSGSKIIIRRSWFISKSWILLLICICFDGLSIFMATLPPEGKMYGGHALMVYPPAPPLLPIEVVMGLALNYTTICYFLNKTDVILSLDQLRIVTYPLPYALNVTMTASSLSSMATPVFAPEPIFAP